MSPPLFKPSLRIGRFTQMAIDTDHIRVRGAQGPWNWPSHEQFANDLIVESIWLPGGGARC